MPVRLIIITHAETEATRRAAFPNREGLTQKGAKAARDQWMAMPRHDAAFCSPAIAARETASALGLQAEVDVDLGELDVGRWRGETLAAIAHAEANAAAAWIADPTFAGHGGESIRALNERVARWMAKTIERRGTIIAVAHAAVARAAVIATLGAPATAFWHIEAEPLSMITLTSDSRRWTLREMRR